MSDKFNINGDAIRKLADILVETNLSEIEYEDDGCRVRVARQNSPVTSHAVIAPQIQDPAAASQSAVLEAAAAATTAAANTVAAAADPANHPGLVKSPMVGTTYIASEPGAAPFIKVGDKISVGQPLLVIEAMKVMNQIKAEKAGVVKEIFFKDAAPVEYGEPLLIVEE